MQYGTVPAGPGFVGGNVYSGAGKNTTTDAPVPGMIVYLRDAAGTLLTYTYTDAAGAYVFSNIAYGTYTIYPHDFSHYTIPSAPVYVSASGPSATGVDFKQHTTTRMITPYGWVASVGAVENKGKVTVYPNPATKAINILWNGLTTGDALLQIVDVLGKVVYNKVININRNAGNASVETTGLQSGVYTVILNASSVNYTEQITIQK